MRTIATLLVILLIVLHQDFWWWTETRPFVFGFIPIGLAWHVLISVAAAGVWAFAVRYCWPKDLEVAAHDRKASRDVEL